MILKSLELALAAPEGADVVLVCYGGLDHTRNVAKFFQKAETWTEHDATCMNLLFSGGFPATLHQRGPIREVFEAF